MPTLSDHPVVAAAAGEHVVAAAAVYRIVARAAVDQVRGEAAQDGVDVGEPCQPGIADNRQRGGAAGSS